MPHRKDYRHFGKPLRETFIAEIRKGHGVTATCELLGVNRSTFYQTRRTNKEFARMYDIALDELAEALELEARRRAVDGVDRDVYFQGAVVGQERIYSDKLLEVLMRGRMPEVYGNKQEVTHKGAVKFTIAYDPDPDEAKA